MSQHDASYRRLFNSPYLVRALFAGIINEPWLDLLDWPRLEPLPAEYVGRGLRQRRGDQVWRIPLVAGGHAMVVLMLEHQSRNDRYMALRSSTYCCLLYESLLQRKLVAAQACPAEREIADYLAGGAIQRRETLDGQGYLG